MHSRRVNDMHKYAMGVANLLIATEIDKCPIYLKAKVLKVSKFTSSTGKTTRLWNCHAIFRGRRLSGLHGETCYVLFRDHFSNTLYGASLCSKASAIEWHLQLSQLKRIHFVPFRDSAFVSATVAALEDAHTDDADMFETICQIRGVELDGVGRETTTQRTSPWLLHSSQAQAEPLARLKMEAARC
jgi:hypothetical protein